MQDSRVFQRCLVVPPMWLRGLILVPGGDADFLVCEVLPICIVPLRERRLEGCAVMDLAWSCHRFVLPTRRERGTKAFTNAK